jgi:hypothetical protein
MDDGRVISRSLQDVLIQPAYVLFYTKRASLPALPPAPSQHLAATAPTPPYAQPSNALSSARMADSTADVGEIVDDKAVVAIVPLKQESKVKANAIVKQNDARRPLPPSALAAIAINTPPAPASVASAGKNSTANEKSIVDDEGPGAAAEEEKGKAKDCGQAWTKDANDSISAVNMIDEGMEEEEESAPPCRLKVIDSWRIGIFRFTPLQQKVFVKRFKRPPPLRARNFAQGKHVHFNSDASEEEGELMEVSSNTSAVDPLSPSAASVAVDGAVSKKPARAKDVMSLLTKRSRDASYEGSWLADTSDDGDVSLLHSAAAIQRQLDRKQQEILASRQPSELDKLLDRGRQKKVKLVQPKMEESMKTGVNHFQAFHDRRQNR